MIFLIVQYPNRLYISTRCQIVFFQTGILSDVYKRQQQWLAFVLKEFKLPGFGSYGREAGGVMLSVTGLNHFYYVRDFTDMRCKHSRVLSVIRERLHREPNDGDVFIVMSRNRRIVRMFSFDNRSYSLFEKKFVAGYQFMKVERNGADTVYRIAWKDVVLILENPIVKTLQIR